MSEKVCSICFQDIQIDARPEVCEHIFCLSCLQTWSKHDTFCPCCKKAYEAIVINSTGLLVKVSSDKRKRMRETVYDASVFCELCDEHEAGGEAIICDSCSLGYHLSCLNLLKVPRGSWECHSCRTADIRVHGKSRRGRRKRGRKRKIDPNGYLHFEGKKCMTETEMDSSDASFTIVRTGPNVSTNESEPPAGSSSSGLSSVATSMGSSGASQSIDLTNSPPVKKRRGRPKKAEKKLNEIQSLPLKSRPYRSRPYRSTSLPAASTSSSSLLVTNEANFSTATTTSTMVLADSSTDLQNCSSVSSSQPRATNLSFSNAHLETRWQIDESYSESSVYSDDVSDTDDVVELNNRGSEIILISDEDRISKNNPLKMKLKKLPLLNMDSSADSKSKAPESKVESSTDVVHTSPIPWYKTSFAMPPVLSASVSLPNRSIERNTSVFDVSNSSSVPKSDFFNTGFSLFNSPIKSHRDLPSFSDDWENSDSSEELPKLFKFDSTCIFENEPSTSKPSTSELIKSSTSGATKTLGVTRSPTSELIKSSHSIGIRASAVIKPPTSELIKTSPFVSTNPPTSILIKSSRPDVTNPTTSKLSKSPYSGATKPPTSELIKSSPFVATKPSTSELSKSSTSELSKSSTSIKPSAVTGPSSVIKPSSDLTTSHSSLSGTSSSIDNKSTPSEFHRVVITSYESVAQSPVSTTAKPFAQPSTSSNVTSSTNSSFSNLSINLTNETKDARSQDDESEADPDDSNTIDYEWPDVDTSYRENNYMMVRFHREGGVTINYDFRAAHLRNAM